MKKLMLLVGCGIVSAGVAFGATTFSVGDVFVAVGNGQVQWRLPSGTLNSTLNTTLGGFTTGMAFDSAGNLYVTGFSANQVSKFNTSGGLQGTFGSGHATPECIVFNAAGDCFVGNISSGIRKYNSAGVFQSLIASGIRIDWMDLAADQATMLYTQEGRAVRRHNVASNTALSDFAALPGSGSAFALRILPSGDVLVADGVNIKRLNPAGAVIQTYDVTGEDSWFALNLDPDGTSFWSANYSTANVYKFNIGSGAVLLNFNTGTGSSTVFGLTVFGEITASSRNEIEVTPFRATNDVNTAHTVCAKLYTVSTNGVTNLLVGTTVSFNVLSGPNSGVNGTSVTGSNGLACLTYIGTGGTGTDTIQASFVDDTGKTLSGRVTKLWVQPTNLPPVAICTNLVVPADANCQGSGSVNNGSYDPDTGDTITVVQSPSGPYPIGTNTVTLLVTDNHGASATCSATIIVVDVTAPSITCPSNIVVNTDPGQCSAVVNYSATATDNCTTAAVTVKIYEFYSQSGGGAPYADLQTNFTASSVSFATDTGYNWHPVGPNDPLGMPEFGADITGCLSVAAEGDYTFGLDSDDGSLLFIDGNLVVDDGGVHPPGATTGTVHLTAGSHSFEVQFFECCGGPSGVDLILPAGVTYGACGVSIVCDPPSGSAFPKGVNTVCCTATDTAGNSNVCCFTITVEDHEAPLGACREGVNPSGVKIPTAGKNPKSGQNPDGFYQLLSKDNCDPNPAVYLLDTGSSFVAGPFTNGAVIKLTQSPGRTPSQDPAPAPIAAHLHFKGDGLLVAVDADGNISTPQLCLVPRPPK